eukprot:TRINITY_DN3265_c0_g1_i3.p1 TRINITY_DN3265_c0_g1~~TRINITY_DN3265_c0_g1_i3.p1  ORF type:complete len:557 (-),score=135.66 TRINITY_DN3265_c0_g1_i3:85-1755(-)
MCIRDRHGENKNKYCLKMLGLRSHSYIRLARLLEIVAKAELRIELARLDLAANPHFEPYRAFRRVDRSLKGYVVPRDVEDFLIEHRLRVSPTDVDQVIRNYSTTAIDGWQLTYADFLELVLPRSNPLLRNKFSTVGLLDRPHILDVSIPASVEEGVALVLYRECELYTEKARAASDFLLGGDLTILDAFVGIDVDNIGYIDVINLSRFLRGQGVILSDAELEALIRRLDRDRDSRVVLSEFEAFLRGSHLPGTLLNAPLSPRGRPLTSTIYDAYGHPRPLSPLARSPRALSPLARSPLARSPLARSPLATHLLSHPDYSYTGAKIYDPLYRTGPILGGDDELLVQTLRELVETDLRIEALKTDLFFRRGDFNVYDAFRLFDLENVGYVSLAEFERGLNRLGLIASANEVSLLFRRLDLNRSGVVRFDEFERVLRPRSSGILAPPLARTSLYSRLPTFSGETTLHLTDLLRSMLRAETLADSARLRINVNRRLPLGDAFLLVERQLRGTINIHDFRRILAAYDIIFPGDIPPALDRLDLAYSSRLPYVRETSPRRLY